MDTLNPDDYAQKPESAGEIEQEGVFLTNDEITPEVLMELIKSGREFVVTRSVRYRVTYEDMSDAGGDPQRKRGEVIMKAYEAYDSDPRVHGVDDFEAFRDAVLEHVL